MWRRRFALCSLLLLLSASCLSAATSPAGKPGEPTVAVPASKLREWKNSLQAASASLKASEKITSELKSKLLLSEQALSELESLLSTLRQSQESSQSEIENLSRTLQDLKTRYAELESTLTQLRQTSELLSTSLKAERWKRLRDAILAFLAGAGVGAVTSTLAK